MGVQIAACPPPNHHLSPPHPPLFTTLHHSSPLTHSVHQVKEAFRQAALKWHPDRLKGSDEQELARAHSRFQQVIEAYNVLKDPDLKRNYDRGA